jgi:hypothetical protein
MSCSCMNITCNYSISASVLPLDLSFYTYDVSRASVTVLYRPYFLNAPSSFPENSSAAWQQMVRSRVRTAASATNNVVEKIVEMDAVKFIKPMVYVLQSELGDVTNGPSASPR